MTLAELERLARRELAQLRYPPPNWVLPRAGPDGRPMLDVLVVGGGMCGQTASFALLREGVTNLRCLDRAPRGAEGPWTSFARMDILRSPKHLTGADLGIASLTYRAYHEAKFGVDHWQDAVETYNDNFADHRAVKLEVDELTGCRQLGDHRFEAPHEVTLRAAAHPSARDLSR